METGTSPQTCSHHCSHKLDTFIVSGTRTDSASSWENETDDNPPDFLILLGIALHFQINLLPLTWQPTLEVVGAGATSDIRQSYLSLQNSFVFKRFDPSAVTTDTDQISAFRALTSEALILSDTSIKLHQNIITLVGICWDVTTDTNKVWPVLVFEKAKFGDLSKFMRTPRGLGLKFDERMSLCVDIAKAIVTMHGRGVIHGDIKPDNVLIFEDVPGKLKAKVTDFGYSTLSVRDDARILMPRSPLWCAPEWHHRGFKFEEAIKMDIFSFGMLCFWLLFFTTNKSQHRDFKEQCSQHEITSEWACETVIKSEGRSTQEKTDLHLFFKLTLAARPNERSSHFLDVLPYLTSERIQATTSLPPPTVNLKSFSFDFQLREGLYQLYNAPYQLRKYIALALHEKCKMSSASNFRNLAFQLSCCYKLGFGVEKDDQKCMDFLQKSESSSQQLDKLIDNFKENNFGNEYQEGIFESLNNQGLTKNHAFLGIDGQQRIFHGVEGILRREIADVEDVLGSQNNVTALLKSQLAMVLSEQGRWKEAEELQRQLSIYANIAHGEASQTALSVGQTLMILLQNQGKLDEADKMGRKVLQAQETLLGHEHILTLLTVSFLARVMETKGDYIAAENLNKRALQGREQVLGQDHPDTLMSAANLGGVFNLQAKHKESLEMMERVLMIRTNILGPEHEDTLLSVSNLATTLTDNARYDEAEGLRQQALAGCEKILGAEHPTTLAVAISLSGDLQYLGRFREAEKIARKALINSEKKLGAEHLTSLAAMSNLGHALHCLGENAEALEVRKRALTGTERALGRAHQTTITAVRQLGSSYQSLGENELAEDMYRRALEVGREAFGSLHPQTLKGMSSLTNFWEKLGRSSEAEPLAQEALEGREKILGEKHPDTISSAHHMATVLSNEGKYEMSEKLLRRVLDMRNELLGPENPETLLALQNLATVLVRQGKNKEAKVFGERAVQGNEKILGSRHPYTIQTIENLARALFELGKHIPAKDLIQKANSVDGNSPFSPIRSSMLAVIYQNNGQYSEAEQSTLELLEWNRMTHGPDHDDTLITLHNLSLLLNYQSKIEEVERVLLLLLEGRMARSGTVHPATLETMRDLASIQARLNKFELSELQLRQALNGYIETFGLEDPNTKATANELASLLKRKESTPSSQPDN